MSIFDSEQILAQAAALAEPASQIMHDFANNPLGSDPIQTESGPIIALSDLIEFVKVNASMSGGGKIFSTIASGLSNTITNQIFIVLDVDTYKVYGNVSSAALFLGTLSTENFTTDFKEKLFDLPNSVSLADSLAQLQADIDTKAVKGANSDITQIRATRYYDPIVISNTVSGSRTMDLSASTTFEFTLIGNTTLSFTNVPTIPANTLLTVLVTIKQDATGRTLTLPANTTIITSGGVAIPTPAANKQQDYIFTTKNGTNWEVRAGANT